MPRGTRPAGGPCLPSFHTTALVVLLSAALVGRTAGQDPAAAVPAAGPAVAPEYGRPDFVQDPTICPDIKDYGIVEDSANIDSAVYDLHWGRQGTIFAISQGQAGKPSKLYRSKNAGGQWDDVSAQLEAARNKAPNGSEGVLGDFDLSVQQVIVHDENKDKVVVQGASIWYWTSTDGGVNFRAVESPGGTFGYLHELRMHPAKPDWMLVMVTRSGESCSDYVHSGTCASDLFYSADFGTSWKNLTENAGGDIAGFVDFDWGVNVHTTHTAAEELLPHATILATVYTDPKSVASRQQSWAHDVTFIRSDNFFKHKDKKSETLVHCAHSFELVSGIVYLARPNGCPVDLDGSKMKYKHADLLDGISLYVSSDQGKSFERACLPTALNDNGYSMVETHDGLGAYIAANHNNDGEGVPYYDWTITNIYSAGSNPAVFTLSLPNGYSKAYDTFPDFHPVAGMPGVIIANQEVNTDAKHAFEIRGEDRKDTAAATVISTNGGGSWQPLLASASDSDYYYPQCNRCTKAGDHCYLYLHGASSWRAWYNSPAVPSVYSHAAAPGVILATGNTGPWGTGLSTDPEELCTFVSTDGGFSWSDVAPHAGIYEFGDAGGVIMLAQHGVHGPTDHVLFSVDGGVCFDTLPLKSALNIDNISVDEDATGTVFIVHGTECSQDDNPRCTQVGKADYAGEPQGIMFAVDVTKLKLSPTDGTVVSGFPDGMCAPGDYVIWQPSDFMGPYCLLGHHVSIEKRAVEDYAHWNDDPKPKRCQNGVAFIRSPERVNPVVCGCSASDLECDFGYMREPASKECTLIADRIPMCEAIDHQGYAISSSAERLVHGDMCSGLGRLITDTDGKGHFLNKKQKAHQPPNATLKWNDKGYINGPVGGTKSRRWLWIFILAGSGAAALAFWWKRYAGHGTKAAIMDLVAPVLAPVLALCRWIWGALASRVPFLRSRYQPMQNTYANMEENPAYDPI